MRTHRYWWRWWKGSWVSTLILSLTQLVKIQMIHFKSIRKWCQNKEKWEKWLKFLFNLEQSFIHSLLKPIFFVPFRTDRILIWKIVSFLILKYHLNCIFSGGILKWMILITKKKIQFKIKWTLKIGIKDKYCSNPI